MKFQSVLLLACACLSVHFHLYSQTHDKDGYYINLKGDTVAGKFVNYEEATWSPSTVSFLAAGSADPINLSPEQCKKFSVSNSDTYISYQGKRQINSIDFHNSQPSDTGDVYQDVSAFLRQLFDDGHYSLYQFNDKKRPNFFVSYDNGPLQELAYKEFMDNTRVVEWPGFRLQLAVLFQPILQKRPGHQRLIDNVAYTNGALTELFIQMTNGKRPESAKTKYPAQFFVGFGASSNSLKVSQAAGFAGLFTTRDDVAAYPSQNTALFEAGVKFSSQRNYGRLFLMIKANYYQFKHTAYFDDGSGYHTTTTFKASAFSLPIGLGYKFINSKEVIFELSAGISPLLLTKSTETKDQPGVVPALVVKDNGKNLNFGFFGESSLVFYNRLAFFAGYYSPVSISNAAEYNVVHSSFRYGLRLYVF